MCLSNTDLNLDLNLKNRIGRVGRVGVDPQGERKLDPPSLNTANKNDTFSFSVLNKKYPLSDGSKDGKFTIKNKKGSWYGSQGDIDNFFTEDSEVCFCGDVHSVKYLPQFTSEGKRNKVLKSGETFSAIRSIIDRMRGK